MGGGTGAGGVRGPPSSAPRPRPKADFDMRRRVPIKKEKGKRKKEPYCVMCGASRMAEDRKAILDAPRTTYHVLPLVYQPRNRIWLSSDTKHSTFHLCQISSPLWGGPMWASPRCLIASPANGLRLCMISRV